MRVDVSSHLNKTNNNKNYLFIYFINKFKYKAVLNKVGKEKIKS